MPLEELEIHLREEIERQMKLGINEQQAFEFAVQEIGNAKMLKYEFKKNQLAEELRKRKLNQKLLAGCLLAITLLIVFIVLSSRTGILENNLTNAQQISMLTGLSVMIMLAVGGRLATDYSR